MTREEAVEVLLKEDKYVLCPNETHRRLWCEDGKLRRGECPDCQGWAFVINARYDEAAALLDCERPRLLGMSLDELMGEVGRRGITI